MENYLIIIKSLMFNRLKRFINSPAFKINTIAFAAFIGLNFILGGAFYLSSLPLDALMYALTGVNFIILLTSFYSTRFTGWIYNTEDYSAGSAKENPLTYKFKDKDDALKEINISEIFAEIIDEYSDSHPDIKQAYKNGYLKLRYCKHKIPNAFATGLWPSRASVTLMQGTLLAIDETLSQEQWEKLLATEEEKNGGTSESIDLRTHFKKTYGSEENGLIKLKNKIIKSILIHEVGHIAHRDSFVQIALVAMITSIDSLLDYMKGGYGTTGDSYQQPKRQEYLIIGLEALKFPFHHLLMFVSRSREHYADLETVKVNEKDSLYHELALGLNCLKAYSPGNKEDRERRGSPLVDKLQHHTTKHIGCASCSISGNSFSNNPFILSEREAPLGPWTKILLPMTHPSGILRFRTCQKEQERLSNNPLSMA